MSEEAKILDEVAEVYLKLREIQREVVFGKGTEKQAEQKRKKALGYVTTALSEILKKHGDPRADK